MKNDNRRARWVSVGCYGQIIVDPVSYAFLPNLIVCFSCSDEDVVLSIDGFFKVKREKKNWMEYIFVLLRNRSVELCAFRGICFNSPWILHGNTCYLFVSLWPPTLFAHMHDSGMFSDCEIKTRDVGVPCCSWGCVKKSRLVTRIKAVWFISSFHGSEPSYPLFCTFWTTS